MDEVELAKRFVSLILNNGTNPTVEGISDLYEIHNGNKKVLLGHLKAIYGIIGRAIDKLEGK